MISFIKFIWQLPQNIIGLIILAINFKSAKKYDGFFGVKYLCDCGISLGDYIILDNDIAHPLKTIKHEQGHQKQSLILGPLYLIIIGLPSLIGNIWDRVYYSKHLNPRERYYHYYDQPWEKWADKLGGVQR